MSDTIYPEKIMRLLGLWPEYLRQEDDEGRRKVWDKAPRQLWATPGEFVRGLEAIAQRTVTVDLCAEPETTKAPLWCGPGSNIGVEDAFNVDPYSLQKVVHGGVAWCNPDFLRKDLWASLILKAGLPTWFLTPPTTDQAWFGRLHEDPRCHLTVLTGRLRFVPPPGVEDSSPKGGGVVLWQVNFDAPVLPPVLDWREVCEIGRAVAA